MCREAVLPSDAPGHAFLPRPAPGVPGAPGLWSVTSLQPLTLQGLSSVSVSLLFCPLEGHLSLDLGTTQIIYDDLLLRFFTSSHRQRSFFPNKVAGIETCLFGAPTDPLQKARRGETTQLTQEMRPSRAGAQH